MAVFKVNTRSYTCPVELALSVIGGKWKGLILHRLRKETLRFSELKKLLPDITDKMLIQQLRELESDGIISRKVYPVVPPKVEYKLTAKGKELSPVIESMRKWGLTYKQ